MISAVNGPCNMHSEVPLMGDIVLASEDAYFQDASHFPRGQVPGDGQHVIWSFLAGHTRARYFLLTGKKLSAQEAKEWGVVNEVLPKGQTAGSGLGTRARTGQAPAADAALHPSTVHQPAQARLHRRARARAGPRDLRAARVLPVRRRDGTTGSTVGPAALERTQRTTGRGRSAPHDRHPATARHRQGQVHARLSRTRHRPGELRGLASPRSSSPPSARPSSSETGCAWAVSNGCRGKAPTSPESSRDGWRPS